MTKHYISAIKAEVELCQPLVTKAKHLPRRGVNAATGLPVGPESYTPCAEGWTAYHAPIVEHPKGGQWSTELIDPDTDGDPDALSVDELTDLRKKYKAGKPLDKTWMPSLAAVAIGGAVL